MENSAEITWLGLLLGSLILAIPFAILARYKTGLVKASVISFGRMAAQLILAGLYLKYIFDLNSPAVNFLWIAIMILAASQIVARRSELKLKKFFVPIAVGILTNALINGATTAAVVVGAKAFFNARYLIPMMGMFIGNALNGAIIALRSFYGSLKREEERYRYYLACGASVKEATFSFLSNAFKEAFSPTIASTATIGLIWLPGMMTGQILGGADPISAVKYQITIIVGIFAGSVVSVFVALIVGRRYSFDDYDSLSPDVFASPSRAKLRYKTKKA